MRGADVREVFETILPDEVLMELVDTTEFQQRERKLDALHFLRSSIIAASRGEAGRQAAILDLYFETGAARVVRGAGYRWFSEAYEAVMANVAFRALAYAAGQPRDLPGWLGEVVADWHIVDSSTVRLDDALRAEYPGTGDFAALKVHKRFSVGVGTTIDYHLSPAREHDCKHLTIDETWRGLGLIVDLGYASLKLLRDCEHFDVRYVLRLKESWKPKVDRIVRGSMTAPLTKGSDLDLLLDEDQLLLDGETIDADVTVGCGASSVRCRLVAIEVNGTYCFYLTNLPRRVGPKQVQQLYRVRWEIELDNKLDKSCLQLDRIGAKNAHTARALVHASMAASIAVCMLAHKHRLEEGRPSKPNTPRTKSPVHPQNMSRMLAVSAMRIAMTMSTTGPDADKVWDDIAAVLLHRGVDPNWRTRPSILDQLRGWAVTPAKPRKSRRARAN